MGFSKATLWIGLKADGLKTIRQDPATVTPVQVYFHPCDGKTISLSTYSASEGNKFSVFVWLGFIFGGGGGLLFGPHWPYSEVTLCSCTQQLLLVVLKGLYKMRGTKSRSSACKATTHCTMAPAPHFSIFKQ